MAITEFNEALFSSQIDALGKLLQDFHGLLQTESGHLKHLPNEALTATIEQKATLAQQLEAAMLKIEASLKPHNSGASFIELAKNGAFSSISEALQNKIDHIIQLSQACNDLNTSNGITIQILNNINEFSIDLLTGKSQDNVKLYGSSGEKQTHSKSQSSLGKA